MKEKPSLLAEYLRFLKEERRYWMIPIVLLVVLMGTLVVLFESSPLAPFIYALF